MPGGQRSKSKGSSERDTRAVKRPAGPSAKKKLQDAGRASKNEAPLRNVKRQKTDKTAAEELVCAITLELPIEAVAADDGRIYERSAIEEHIKSCRRRKIPLRSPMTNEHMGVRLLPLPQIKNVIQSMINDGSVRDDLAEDWKNKTDTLADKKRAYRRKPRTGSQTKISH